MNETLFTEADIISTYTRAQALEDGFLVDLNQWIPIHESGFKFPVACTSAVFAIIEKAVNNKHHCNDYKGVIWDIFSMARLYMRSNLESDSILFKVIITGAARQKYFVFRITITGGDDGEPVFTILLPKKIKVTIYLSRMGIS